MKYNFQNTYTQLSPKLFQSLPKPQIENPQTLLLNTPLIKRLGIGYSNDQNPDLLFGSPTEKAFAQAYAGHQFGYPTMLGDGRAMMVGEHLAPNKNRYDIQLKGSGRTKYSRGGDGKATMSSMIREYLFSHSMKNLGIKTSESIAVLSTNQKVLREEVHEGAILIRVMKSHIRFGTFEYVSSFCTPEEFKEFTDYTIKRHYPQLSSENNEYLEFFKSVIQNAIDMVVDWYRVGFIHGVMNTDNMSITGETFDYGPCAFMNRYDRLTTFSQIDSFKRYCFGNQKDILKWNLSVLGKTLLPLFDDDLAMAEKKYKHELENFDSSFEGSFLAMMKRKLGIGGSQPAKELIIKFLSFTEQNKADYTNTFIELMEPQSIDDDIYQTPEFIKLRTELAEVGLDRELMQSNNPRYILRNYLVEEAIDDYRNTNSLDKVHALIEAVSSPYNLKDSGERFQRVPSRGFDSSYRTHCNT